MEADAPLIYLLHGDDEYAISQWLSNFEGNLGEPALIEANTSRLDGRSFNLDELEAVVSPMPFLAKRRLVILENPLSRLESREEKANFYDKQKMTREREALIRQFERVPPTTALVLVERKLLTADRDRESGSLHWLERWASASRPRVYVKSFPLPRGMNMNIWIQSQAAKLGGQFTLSAARLLADLVDDDTRLADQEIHKLLDYVNYARPVDEADVQLLTADASEADIFTLVDALGARDAHLSSQVLHRLLEQQDPNYIFVMVVRQFRMLLLVREILDQGGGVEDVSSKLGFLRVRSWMARKLIPQAQRFGLEDLIEAYRRLLELDENIKTGIIPVDLGLEIFTGEITNPNRSR